MFISLSFVHRCWSSPLSKLHLHYHNTQSWPAILKSRFRYQHSLEIGFAVPWYSTIALDWNKDCVWRTTKSIRQWGKRNNHTLVIGNWTPPSPNLHRCRKEDTWSEILWAVNRGWSYRRCSNNLLKCVHMILWGAFDLPKDCFRDV